MTRSSLLSIGAFSNATQLSAKALRLYAEHGILLPAYVDAETGYRYYRSEQVRLAREVRLLRELDVPLSMIAGLLRDRSEAAAAAKQQVDALARRYSRQQHAYRDLLALLSETEPAAPAEVEVRVLPAVSVAVHDFEAERSTLLTRAQALWLRYGGGKDGSPAFVPLAAAPAENEEAPYMLCIPEQEAEHGTRHQQRWPAERAACIRLAIEAGVADVTAASDALFDWFDRQACSLSGVPRLYLGHTGPELAWPIHQDERKT